MTNTEAIMYDRPQIRAKELRRVFSDARKSLGTTANAARVLQQKESKLRSYMNAETVPDLDGTPVATLTVADLEIRTKPQILQKIEFGRIQAVAHLGTPDAIAAFLGLFEDQVRRTINQEAKLCPTARAWMIERAKAWEALRPSPASKDHPDLAARWCTTRSPIPDQTLKENL